MLNKIKKYNLKGRGGANFPIYKKWELVKSQKAERKYIVVNAAEGEPGVFKDAFILKKHLAEFISGVNIARKFIKAHKVYFYLNKRFSTTIQKNIEKELKTQGFYEFCEFVMKPKSSGYIGGDESTILNIIEHGVKEPKIRPPFPVVKGLFSMPTLVHNVESFFDIHLVSSDKYENKRFYTINENNKNVGVYYLDNTLSIKQVLTKTSNWPAYDFFVQVGGDACGEVFNSSQLNREVDGAGSITIYNSDEVLAKDILFKWINFFQKNSCGKCTSCREGTYRLKELFKEQGVLMHKDQRMRDICDNLFLSSFCALGSSVPIPILTYYKNVYKNLSNL